MATRQFIADLFKAGKTVSAAYNIIVDIYGLKCRPDTVKRRIQRIFKALREGQSPEDARHKGNHTARMMRTPTTIKAIKAIIQQDSRTTLREIMKETGISKSTALHMVKKDLKLVKLAARWVPRLLTEAHKEERVRCARRFLRLYQRNKIYLDKIITCNETWVSFTTPETKQRSKQWRFKGQGQGGVISKESHVNCRL